MASVAKRRYGITSKTCMASRASVYPRRLDSMPPVGGFHTALRADSIRAVGAIPCRLSADFIHGCAVIELRKENSMAKTCC